MFSSIFNDISLLFAIGAGIAIIMRLLHQPLIIGHIITGIIAGPVFLGILQNNQAFIDLSSLGVALLLFVVGLDLSLKVFSKLGKVVVATACLQVLLVAALAIPVARAFGFDGFESLIIGLGLALSSTVIVVKLLNDKRETTRLYAQIAIGILLLQHLVATLVKIGISAKDDGGPILDIMLLLGKGAGVTLALYLCSRFIIPKFTRSIESSKELLLLFALGWALGIATLFEHVGLSLEIGALFAGVSLASLPYSKEMASRLKPLRDFFIVLFFVSIGQAIEPTRALDLLIAALVFSAIVLVIKPLLITATMGFLGYTKRNSFKTGIALSQSSELALVFIMSAVAYGLASPNVATVFTLVVLITFAASTYLIKYDDVLYEKFEHSLRFFERRKINFEQHEAMYNHSIIMFGYRKGGVEFARTFKSMKKRFAVVDYDPDVIDTLEHQNIHYIYGDAVDPELLDEIHLDKTKLVVSTISDHKTNMFLAEWMNQHNPKAVLVCYANGIEGASELYELGVSYVMIPHYVGTEKLSAFLRKNGFSKTEFKKYREKHLSHLQTHFSEAD